MKKRIFSILLAILLIVGVMPTAVWADEAVATMNGTPYTTLAEAFAAAKRCDSTTAATIEILQDMTVDSWNAAQLDYLAAGVTINGNGHTITGLTAALLSVTSCTDIVINNLTLKSVANSNTADANGMGLAAFINRIENDGSVTFHNCHVVDSNIDGTGGYIVGAAAFVGYSSSQDNITLNGCSVTNTTISGRSCGAVNGYSQSGNVVLTDTTITDNTVSGTKVTGAVVGRLNADADVIIYSGSYYDNGDIELVGQIVQANDELIVYSGTFDKQPAIASLHEDFLTGTEENMQATIDDPAKVIIKGDMPVNTPSVPIIYRNECFATTTGEFKDVAYFGTAAKAGDIVTLKVSLSDLGEQYGLDYKKITVVYETEGMVQLGATYDYNNDPIYKDGMATDFVLSEGLNTAIAHIYYNGFDAGICDVFYAYVN